MFHVCGWMFPWACTFAHATQITLRTVNNTSIWHHLLNSKVSHYCAAPTVQVDQLMLLHIRPAASHECPDWIAE
jgi:hypothetical protein